MTNKLSASFLEPTQSQEGWWPYVSGKGPSVEATAWCSIACRKNPDCVRKAITHLLDTQKPDGGWSTAPQLDQSDWSSGLALWCLNTLRNELIEDKDKQTLSAKIDQSLEKGYKFLTGLRTDIITDLTRVGLMVMQGPDFDYPRGWPWDANTYHWVEPTAYALLAIKTGAVAHEKRYVNIVNQAHQYLFEKVCKAGGWNFGSPRTLGADWDPEPAPTALVLIALQDAKHPQIDKALAYLRNLSGPTADSTMADSLILIARNLHGDDVSEQASGLGKRYEQRNTQAENLAAVAMGAIASQMSPSDNPLKIRSA